MRPKLTLVGSRTEGAKTEAKVSVSSSIQGVQLKLGVGVVTLSPDEAERLSRDLIAKASSIRAWRRQQGSIDGA